MPDHPSAQPSSFADTANDQCLTEKETPTASLIVVGYSGSGKSTIAAMLASATKLTALEMGDIVREDAAAHSPPREPLAHATAVFESGSVTRFAAMLAERVSGMTRPVIVVGPRRPEEIKLLRAAIGPAVCVGLSVDKATRRKRQRGRLENEFRPDFLRSWADRDEVERVWGLDTSLAQADFLIDGGAPLRDVACAVYGVWAEPKDSPSA